MAHQKTVVQVHTACDPPFEPGMLSRSQTFNSVSSISVDEPLSPSDFPDQPVNQLEKDGRRLLCENSELQMWWDQAMCDELKLRSGYRNAAVLLIKWSYEIDDFKERGETEVLDLKKLFESRFNYKTLLLNLTANHKRSPEEFLQSQIKQFIKKYDSANDLLIIYYSGHGDFDVEKESLNLYAHRGKDFSSLRHTAKFSWNEVEKTLIEEGNGDILVIMDACFAGNLKYSAQRNYKRAYEFLAACKSGRTTAGPGPKSFTHVLHRSLEALLDKEPSFTTRELLAEIIETEERHYNLPDLWSRSASTERDIRLAPHPKSPPSEGEGYFDEKPIPQYLTLRVELKDSDRPTQIEIEELARMVSKAVKGSSIKTRRVDCVSLNRRPATNLRAAVELISKMVRYTKRFSRQLDNQPQLLESLQENRKRSRSIDSLNTDEQPASKRRNSARLRECTKNSRPLTPNSGAEGRHNTPRRT